MKFTLDTKDFDEKFKKIVGQAIPELQEKGMAHAMSSLLNDCIMEVPTVPVDEGTLRGSGSTFVNNQLTGTSEGMPRAKPGTANKGHAESKNKTKLIGVVGFNTPYAAVMHEGINKTTGVKIKHYSEPSSGKKFIETKLIRHAKDYMRQIASVIKTGGK